MKVYAALALRKGNPDPFIIELFKTEAAARTYAQALVDADPTHEIYPIVIYRRLQVQRR